jgi:hypothetical protein
MENISIHCSRIVMGLWATEGYYMLKRPNVEKSFSVSLIGGEEAGSSQIREVDLLAVSLW